jgi:hypothetical protein
MVTLQGTIETGESFDNKLISVDEAIKLLKLDKERSVAKYLLGKKDVQFSFVADKMEPDRNNPSLIRCPASRPIVSTIVVNKGGNDFRLTYWTSKRGDASNPTFEPKHIDMFANGIPHVYFSNEEREKMFIAILSPECADSPYCTPSVTPVYRIFDPVVNSRREAEAEDAIWELQKQLRDFSEKDPNGFMLKAKGLRINGGGIVADFNDPVNVRSAVLNAMRKDFDKFNNTWIDPTSELRGLIQTSLDLNVLEQKQKGGEIEVIKDGQLFCKFPATTTVIVGIMQHMENDLMNIKFSLKNAVSEKTIGRTNTSTSEKFSDVVKKGK